MSQIIPWVPFFFLRFARRVCWVFLFFSITGTAAAQLSFRGLGRTAIQSQNLSGNILNQDTVSDRRTTQGYTLFDLRTSYQFGRILRASADVRVKNQLGGFGGVGNVVSLRQIVLEGFASRFVKYSLGDIDLFFPPFGFRNMAEPFSLAEGDIFTLRRSIVQYENFNADENRRMRGGKALSVVHLKGDSNTLKTNIFWAQNRNPPDSGTTPYVFGATGGVSFSTGLSAEGHWMQFHDPSQSDSRISVAGGSAGFQKPSGAIRPFLRLAGGFSSGKASHAAQPTATDYMAEGRAGFVFRKEAMVIRLIYRETGYFFQSPGVQTIRNPAGAASDFLPTVGNGTTLRPLSMLDRLGSEGSQNRNLSAVLQANQIQYAVVHPYGEATPNRRTYQFAFAQTGQPMLNFSIIGGLSSELTGEGVRNRRQFQFIDFQSYIKLYRWVNGSKKLYASCAYSYESSQRAGDLPVALQVHRAQAGITWEPVSKLEMLCGTKWVWASGNEVGAVYGPNRSIVRYEPIAFRQIEMLLGLGLRYHFTDNAMLFCGYYRTTIADQKKSDKNYRINQIYTTFSFRF